MTFLIEKRNETDQMIPCLRNGCPGVEPMTLHRPSITVSMCEIHPIEPTAVTPETKRWDRPRGENYDVVLGHSPSDPATVDELCRQWGERDTGA